MTGIFFADGDWHGDADHAIQNDPVSPDMRRLWLESDQRIAAQDRERRRAELAGDLRAIGIGLFLALIVVGGLAWWQA